mgnify:CR=1 FL=1
MKGHVAELLATLLPIIVAGLTTVASEYLQRANEWVAARGPFVKRIVVVTVAFYLTKLSAMGVALTGTDVTALTEGDIGAILSAGLAFVFHLGDKVKKETGNA